MDFLPADQRQPGASGNRACKHRPLSPTFHKLACVGDSYLRYQRKTCLAAYWRRCVLVITWAREERAMQIAIVTAIVGISLLAAFADLWRRKSGQGVPPLWIRANSQSASSSETVELPAVIVTAGPVQEESYKCGHLAKFAISIRMPHAVLPVAGLLAVNRPVPQPMPPSRPRGLETATFVLG